MVVEGEELDGGRMGEAEGSMCVCVGHDLYEKKYHVITRLKSHSLVSYMVTLNPRFFICCRGIFPVTFISNITEGYTTTAQSSRC